MCGIKIIYFGGGSPSVATKCCPRIDISGFGLTYRIYKAKYKVEEDWHSSNASYDDFLRQKVHVKVARSTNDTVGMPMLPCNQAYADMSSNL